jgi:hypothetical protein
MSDQPEQKQEQPHRFSNRTEVRQEILQMAKPVEDGFMPRLPDAPPKPKTLAQKILDIQNSVGIVKKKGTHTQGWKYLQIEDAVTAVNKLLVAGNLLFTGTLARQPDGKFDISRTNHHDKGYITDLVMAWTLLDIDSGDKETYYIPGSGFDSTDKGTYKAQTGSRKYAIIEVFNLPVGDNPEANTPTESRESAKAAAQGVAAKKIAEAAARGSQTAIDAISQVEPERKIIISRPQEHNGNYIVVTGMIAVPQLERFFDDTASKRFKTKADLVPYWRVSSEYEKGLIALCEKLQIEVEG